MGEEKELLAAIREMLAEQDKKFGKTLDERFTEQDKRIEARFTKQDKRIEARFTKQEHQIKILFEENDRKMDLIAEQVMSISESLTGLNLRLDEMDRKLANLDHEVQCEIKRVK